MKRIIVALVVGGVVFGGALAMAASLGGIDAKSLGSSTTVVASCDTDGVTVDFRADYDTVDHQMVVDALFVRGLSQNCVGLTARIVMSDAQGDQIWNQIILAIEDGGNYGGQTLTLDPIPAPPPPAEDVANILIAIYEPF
jgi:hypothetical protein